MIFGGLLGAAAPDADTISTMHGLTGAIGWLVVLVLGVGIVNTNSINLYGGVLGTVTFAQTWRNQWLPGGVARALLGVAYAGVAVVMAIAGKDAFLTNYTNFVFLLLYLLVPWTGINLVDYYLIKRGDYHVDSFFEADGGIYGRFNVPALVVYAVGVAVQVPFVATTLYTGPVAKSLDGVDLAWLVGLAVVCPLYYWAGKRYLSHEIVEDGAGAAAVPVVETV
jgi:NCS1 family nucleobase:cation symporter-1